MENEKQKKILFALIPIVIALLSFFVIALLRQNKMRRQSSHWTIRKQPSWSLPQHLQRHQQRSH